MSPSKRQFVRALPLLGALLSAGCVVAPAPYPGYVQADIAPPPPRVEVVGVAPAPGYFWISGYWWWGSGGYVWRPGYWHAPRPGYRWVEPRWQRHGQAWRGEPGHWQRR